MLRSFILLAFACCSVHGSASCTSNGQLGVYSYKVEKQGIEFQRSAVNRSIPVSLVYKVEANDLETESVSWMYDGKVVPVDENEGKEIYYTVTKQSGLEVTLFIRTPTVRVSGNWTLSLTTSDGQEHVAVCFIEAPPIFKDRLGAVRTNEGNPLALRCELESYPYPSEIVWKHVLESESGNKLVPVVNTTYKMEHDVKNYVMEWKDATNAAGFYMCEAQSARGSDSLIFEVRIKGMTTILWPCIGIILELLVLGVTIGVYEHAQSKKRKAELLKGDK